MAEPQIDYSNWGQVMFLDRPYSEGAAITFSAPVPDQLYNVIRGQHGVGHRLAMARQYAAYVRSRKPHMQVKRLG